MHTENYEALVREIKQKNQINGEICHVNGLEDSTL